MPNVEAVQAAYAAFSRGDRAGALAAFSPDVVWEQAQGLPHGGTYRGLAAVEENVFGPLTRDWWERFDAPVDEVIDAAPHVVAIGRYRGVAKGTGRSLDVPYVHIWTFENGVAVRFRQYLDTAGWNHALAGPSPAG
ncbi:MAG: nuclear transport factor 2 family protein [Gaiellales bacterium]